MNDLVIGNQTQNSYCDNKYNTKIVENYPKIIVFFCGNLEEYDCKSFIFARHSIIPEIVQTDWLACIRG